MAKKEKRSGLGRGLDSLIPNIEEQEVEEGITLEDALKKSADAEMEEEVEEIVEDPIAKDKEFTEEPVDEDKELVFTEEDFNNDDDILVEEEEIEKYEEEIVEEEVEDDEKIDEESKKSSKYTNVFFNDDEKLKEDDEKIEEKIINEKSVENIDSAVNLNEKDDESTQIIEAFDDLKEGQSLLTEKEEKLIDEVIETVEKNPRITLWSAKSAAVLRFLRKTEPEFSISNEASNLIDEAIAKKYPEIWTLFNHL